MNAAAIRVSRDKALDRLASGTAATAEPAARAGALVVVMTINRLLDVRPPPIGPKMLAYRPCTGFTPARTPAAIPSGTPLIAPGRPATRSLRTAPRSGATDRSQRSALPPIFIG